jgi:hypothetical protein
MTTTPECVAEHFSNGLGVVVGGNDEGTSGASGMQAAAR